jgi:hypothetical protein
MTEGAWVASVVLALVGGFVAGIGTETSHRKIAWAVGALFIAPLLIRVWVVAIAG